MPDKPTGYPRGEGSAGRLDRLTYLDFESVHVFVCRLDAAYIPIAIQQKGNRSRKPVLHELMKMKVYQKYSVLSSLCTCE